MSTVKTIAVDDKSIAPKSSAPDEVVSTEAKQETKTDNRVAVYVKINQRAREILDAAAIAPRTRATVIEALLESYDKELDPVVRGRILSGQNPNALKEHGELLQLRSWAEHAFQNKRYVWAGRMYRILANHPSSSEGLKNICDYRLSLCLIRLSYDVREEALAQERWVDKESYYVAIQTLEKAISYTRQLRDRLDRDLLLFPKLVLYYNLASCHSLKAQYMVESELDPESPEVERLHKVKKYDVEGKADVWKTIGQTWRDKQQQRNVDSEASKALDALQEIFPLLSHGKTLPDPDQMDLDLSSERIWLVDLTLTDEDFIFLRSDKLCKGEFESWSSKALEGRKPTSEAVLSLLDGTPRSASPAKQLGE